MTKHQESFYLLYGYDAAMAVRIHRLPGISVDMVMVIIRTSVSGTRIINVVHVAVFCYRPLPDCTQDLQLTLWNHLPLCKCITHQKQYITLSLQLSNFVFPIVTPKIESALPYCFHLKERHPLLNLR